MFKGKRILIVWPAVLLAIFAVGCKKKAPAPPPPPPPAPVVAQFAANPATIQRGQSSTLSWQVTGQTTSISINQGIGTVQATGSQQVQPTGTLTYVLSATGPGGTTTASATVTVTIPPAPVIARFTASPSSIQRGQSAELSWQVTGQATSISINQGIGAVQATGSQRVQPNDSTTYTLTATGIGGSNTASATLTVTAPPPPPPPPPPRPTIEQRLAAEVQDAFFDYDKSEIRPDARDVLTRDATALKAILADFPGASIVIGGYCDERGSAEYNIGLGDRRAGSAKDFLAQLGVSADRLRTISYGKENAKACKDTADKEGCWQADRHVHFTAGQ